MVPFAFNRAAAWAVLAVLWIPASRVEAQEPTFTQTPVWEPLPDDPPRCVAWGDVDLDGDLDLVCGYNYRPPTLYLNEHGTLSANPVWESTRSNETSAVALGDVDGDGDLDLVCGNAYTPTTLYRNEGGTFTGDPIWATGRSDATSGVVLGDVDRDGDLDLVCSNTYPATTLYMNEGGVFSVMPVWDSGIREDTWKVALGDVDGDGDLDLVCGNLSTPTTLYRNEEGTFSARPVWMSAPGDQTYGLALGDVDGDGDVDLVCGNYASKTTLYRNEGGTFTAAPVWRSDRADYTACVVLGDVDGDEDLDLVCGNDSQKTTLYRNEGGNFTGQPVWESDRFQATYDVALGDVDHDDDLDLLCGNFGTKSALYRNEGATFSGQPVWESDRAYQTFGLEVGDVDGDGDLDLVCGNYADRSTLYRNDGGAFTEAPVWESDRSDPTIGVALGDVDADGDPDLVCGNDTQKTTLYRNDGGTFTGAPVWESEGSEAVASVVLGDVDGDDDLDLVSGNPYVGSKLFVNVGGVFSSSPIWESPQSEITLSVALGDADGDGDLDLACGNSGRTTLYRNEGVSFSAKPVWKSASTGYTIGVAWGDVDGNGDLDLMCGNSGEPFRLYLNQGGALSPEPAWETSAVEYTNGVALGDVDGDGDLDLVSGNYEQPNRLYLNQGGALSTQPAWESSEPVLTNGIALGDVDGDGDLDLMCASDPGPSLFRNDVAAFGARPAWYSGRADRTTCVALADVDHDHDLDLVTGNDRNNRLYRNDSGTLLRQPTWTNPFVQETQDVAVGDVTGDAVPDLVSGTIVSRTLIQAGEAGGFAGRAYWTAGRFDNTYGVALQDVDDDGDLDLACGNVLGASTLYRNEGSTLTTDPVWVSGRADFTKKVALGDIDGDGHPDLICGNDGDRTTLYRNEGGLLGDQPVWYSGLADNTWDVALGDLDADGDLDLVCGNFGQRATLYPNDGGNLTVAPGWFSSHRDDTRAVALGDVDADGDLDLVCGNYAQPSTLYLNEEGVLADGVAWFSGRRDATQDVALGDLDEDGLLDFVCGNMDTASALYLHRKSWLPADATANVLSYGSAYIRDVVAEPARENVYRIRFRVFDRESDPCWIVADYQVDGTTFLPAAVAEGAGNRRGPFTSSPTGIEHEVEWDVQSLPVEPHDIALRLRAVSIPRGVSLVQSIPAYVEPVGRVQVIRPSLVTSLTVDFPAVTLGDTVSAPLLIRNRGTVDLVVSAVHLPSTDLMLETPLPLTVPPRGSAPLAFRYAPQSDPYPLEPISIENNDPTQPALALSWSVSVLPVAFESRLLGPLDALPAGKAVTIEIVPAPLVRVESGYIFYRPSGSGTSFTDSVAVFPSSSGFLGTIPDNGVTEPGIDFYVRLENSGFFGVDPPGAPAEFLSKEVGAPSFFTTAALPTETGRYLVDRDTPVLLTLAPGARFVSGRLFYRAGGGSAYDSLDLSLVDVAGQIRPGAVIPRAHVGPRGLEYWVRLNTVSSVLTDPSTNPRQSPRTVRTSVFKLEEPTLHEGGRYRMISIPLELELGGEGSLEALLADQPELGVYDPFRWRAFRYVPADDTYLEVSQDTTGYLRPQAGRGFWFVAQNAHRIDTAPVPGRSTSTAGPVDITLEPGWNQIGSPFLFRVAWSDVETASALPDGAVEPPVGWDEDAQQYVPETTTLLPFAGYWVKNNGGAAVVLRVPAREALPEEPSNITGGAAPRLWIAATSGGVRDDASWIGVAPGGAAGRDAFDRSDPPLVPGRALSLYFPDPAGGDPLTADVRGTPAEGAAGDRWSFDIVKTFVDEEVGDEVVLDLHGLASFPEGWTAVLVDREASRSLEVREGTRYTFRAARRERQPNPREARLELIAGTAEYLEHARPDIAATPARTRLLPNAPNPFRTATLIQYELAERGPVEIEIYDVQGRRVRVVYEGVQDAGHFDVVWKGDDARGEDLAPGIYFCRIIAGPAREARKMLKSR